MALAYPLYPIDRVHIIAVCHKAQSKNVHEFWPCFVKMSSPRCVKLILVLALNAKLNVMGFLDDKKCRC